jgi:hypothetical protein
MVLIRLGANVTDGIQAISAFLSMLAAVVLAAFAAVQIGIYQRQTRVMALTLRATARSVRASQRSANAAENAVTKSDAILVHAQDTAKKQLRAYVFFEGASLKDGPSKAVLTGGQVPGSIMSGCANVTINIKNFGQTPAYNVRHTSVIKFDSVDAADTIALNPEDKTPTTIAPTKSTISSNATREPLAIRGLEELKNAKAFITIYGRIIYDDVFGDPHWTNYRLQWFGNYPPADSAIFNFSASGNDAD